jgi:GAF domain-containing protein
MSTPPQQPGSSVVTDAARLQALYAYAILDTPAEKEFDEYTQLAAYICDTPYSLISLVEVKRQWFKSAFGLADRETPIDQSICRHAIEQNRILVIPDTTLDERTRLNPLVAGDPGFRFYAGAILKSREGQPLGTLCVLDQKPRKLSDAQIHALEILARKVMANLELRLALQSLATTSSALQTVRADLRSLERLLPICASCKKIRSEDDQWHPVETYLRNQTGANLTHGYCPTCAAAYLADLRKLTDEK